MRTAAALLLLIPVCAFAAWPEPTVTVPFVEGLTTVRSISEPAGDYESLRTIDSIKPDGYTLTLNADVPSEDGETDDLEVTRFVLAADQQNARQMRLYFHSDDPTSFPKTVPGVSRAILMDLRTSGKAQLTFLDVGSFFGSSMIIRTLPGEVARIGNAPVPVSVLVNGVKTQLPAIHAKGSVKDEDGAETLEFYVLDNPDNPLVLKLSGPNIATADVTRIEYPVPAAAQELEKSLDKRETVQIRGIYFAFGSDRIRRKSERVLREISDVMHRHPDWKLRIDGHTDAVGSDSANLDLSRRRAAAVKAALVQRYGIVEQRLVSEGHGESSPVDTNDTPEGRARNRRVELRRE
jgi:outer membrane protein OmpA-like peptidoglycan-associated protein